MITPSWLSVWLRSFLYSSVCFWHFLISSYSIRSVLFLSFTAPRFAWNVPLVSNFHEEISAAAKSLQSCLTLWDPIIGSPPGFPSLGFSRQDHWRGLPLPSPEEISTLSNSIVFLYFFALITEEGFLISPCYSLELCIQIAVSFLFSFAFCFSTFLSCLQGLFRQSFWLFAFLLLVDGFDHHLLYNVMNLRPQFFMHSIYQIESPESPSWLALGKNMKQAKCAPCGLNFMCMICFLFLHGLSYNIKACFQEMVCYYTV